MDWKILQLQPELRPFAGAIEARMAHLAQTKQRLLAPGQKLVDFANGHLYYGLHRMQDGWVYREWAPGAQALHLIGDFNGWDRSRHPLRRLENGSWEIHLPGRDSLRHLSRYKVCVTAGGRQEDKMPLYCRCTRQDPETGGFSAVVWAPESPYRWQNTAFAPARELPPLIYEAHVGMSAEEGRVASYREFADSVLPRIQAGGYNTVQLMAVMEHPYYGSFGYHVSNFFAASSRFGTPDDLKYLVDRAHGLGLRVLLDLVHSHAVKNTLEGIHCFDGTPEQFFKPGAAGDHPAWGSKLFDYGKSGVLHFLLSNLKFWLEEYRLDGFRFDGVTSMLYHDHGLGVAFTEPACYFSPNTDADAVTYLQLATELIHELSPRALLVAEDMSAMPGMCLPVSAGGIGFDYRLSMGLPDYYIRTIRERRDGCWDMSRLCWELTAKRNGEKRIAYAESHDQALVGDQTLMFRLAGAEMYTGMCRNRENLVIERAMALHKMIRLVTISAGGEGYLNFMGNEFGHPEWIDFPREGNGWSYAYARRQWSLAEREELRYGQLGAFDRAMVCLFRDEMLLAGAPARCLRLHEADQLLLFARRDYLFLFNFHPSRSQPALYVPAPAGRYRVVLSTDEPRFGGQGRISGTVTYSAEAGEQGGFLIYLPARTGAVLKKLKT